MTIDERSSTVRAACIVLLGVTAACSDGTGPDSGDAGRVEAAAAPEASADDYGA